MYIINEYSVAVAFCVVTMLCWGSWANTSKISTKEWPFPLFYWDYALGLIIAALLFGLTMGSTGSNGRGFLADLIQADSGSLLWPSSEALFLIFPISSSLRRYRWLDYQLLFPSALDWRW